jgi:hypothetical protein
MIIRSLIFLFLFTAIVRADVCTEELLLSYSWKPYKSSDIYTLKNNGDMDCYNERRHRNECDYVYMSEYQGVRDYVYMSEYQGVPKSWELVSESTIKLTFKSGIFSKETIEYDCEFISEDKKLKVGRIILIRIELFKE